MAVLHLNFNSSALCGNTDVNVIIPNGSPKCRRTMYLYHGTNGDYASWLRRSLIEEYAINHNINVVMPSVGNSFFQTFSEGPDYKTYLGEELPSYMHQLFSFSEAKDDNITAGLSMGGYGAWFIALSYPERFGWAISLSGALEFPFDLGLNEAKERNLFCFDRLPWPLTYIKAELKNLNDANVVDLISKINSADVKLLPRLYAAVGKDDFLLDSNKRVMSVLANNGILITFDVLDGGHNWSLWNRAIDCALNRVDSALR